MKPTLIIATIGLLFACNSGTTEIQPISTVKSDCDPRGQRDEDKDFSLRSYPTYKDEIADLLDEHCLGCHSDGGSSPVLEDWKDVQDAARAVVSAIENERMPPKDDLDEKTVRIFTLWEKADFPETVDDIDADEDDEEDEDRQQVGSSSDDC